MLYTFKYIFTFKSKKEGKSIQKWKIFFKNLVTIKEIESDVWNYSIKNTLEPLSKICCLYEKKSTSWY
jgi:hypothetical protein